MSVPKSPYKKGKGFCPNPIAKNGIPKYADSKYNKNVIGTPDWEKFWEEQLYYIIHQQTLLNKIMLYCPCWHSNLLSTHPPLPLECQSYILWYNLLLCVPLQ